MENKKYPSRPNIKFNNIHYIILKLKTFFKKIHFIKRSVDFAYDRTILPLKEFNFIKRCSNISNNTHVDQYLCHNMKNKFML